MKTPKSVKCPASISENPVPLCEFVNSWSRFFDGTNRLMISLSCRTNMERKLILKRLTWNGNFNEDFQSNYNHLVMTLLKALM